MAPPHAQNRQGQDIMRSIKMDNNWEVKNQQPNNSSIFLIAGEKFHFFCINYIIHM